MPLPTIRTYQPEDREAVVAVWRAAGLVVAAYDPYADIDRKRAVDPEGILVALLEERLVGAVMVGYEGRRGWINYLGVDPAEQGQGVGKALMQAAIDLLQTRGCPKVNLQVRRTNTGVIEFYEQLGFIEDQVVSMGLRLDKDKA